MATGHETAGNGIKKSKWRYFITDLITNLNATWVQTGAAILVESNTTRSDR